MIDPLGSEKSFSSVSESSSSPSSSSTSSSSAIPLGGNCGGCSGPTPEFLRLRVPQLRDTYYGLTLAAGTYELKQESTNPCCWWAVVNEGAHRKYLWVSIGVGTVSAGWTGFSCGSGFPSRGQAMWKATNSPPAKWSCMTLNVTMTGTGDSYLNPNPPGPATLTSG